jgi:colicin import membrane protein
LAQADRQAADHRDQVGELRAKLAAMSARRDAAVHDAEREKAHGDQRVDDLRARHEEVNRRRREELAELRHELTNAREDVRVQRSRAESRLGSTTVPTNARRRQSCAGRRRRRDEATATGTEPTRD